MKVYTYTEARQRLASLLERAKKEGGVRIRRRNGQLFVLKPEQPAGSPLDVKGIDLGVTTEEIVAFVRESRKIRPRG
ncbi:MAG: type II toxin-antitoxin system Phd/YefM family antitoxin [Nitrospirota bacterium]